MTNWVIETKGLTKKYDGFVGWKDEGIDSGMDEQIDFNFTFSLVVRA